MNVLVFLSLTLLGSPLLGNAQHRWDAKQYAYNSSPQFKNAIKKISSLGLKGDEHLLDIGCGNGQLAAYILKKYLPKGTIHGIDFSAEQISRAQEQYAYNKRLSFEQANALTYKPAKPYDAIISFWVLHWVKNYKQALRTIFNALKPGGKALIGHLAEHDLTLSKEIKKLMTQEQWKSYCKDYEFPIHSFSVEKIASDARAVGFKINYLQLINETERFKNRQAYQEHYQVLPVAGCVPPEKQKMFFEQAMTQALPHEKHNPDGSITVNGYVVYMVLEKPNR